MDNSILSNKEWKEFDYGNPVNTTTDSFFKAHDECNIKEGNELRQMKHKGDNENDEQPIKRACKAENFEAVQGILDSFYVVKWLLKYSKLRRNAHGGMLLEEADLEHGLEHAVSSYYRANPGESSLILLLFLNFHFLNCTIGALYKPSEEMGIKLSLD
ncbi:hypothetical protein Tco_0633969 [Tanacetum coccineum]